MVISASIPRAGGQKEKKEFALTTDASVPGKQIVRRSSKTCNHLIMTKANGV